MKLYTILLSLLLSIVSYAQEIPSVYYLIHSDVDIKQIGLTKLINTNEYITIDTKENHYITILLPNKVLINIEPESSFVINSATIDIDNINEPPQSLKVKSNVYVFSLLNGTANIIVDNVSNIRLYTPRVNLIASNGCYKVNVQGKTTKVMNINGSITATGLVKRKNEIIQPKAIGLITTYLPPSNTENISDRNKPTLTQYDIDDDDFKSLEKSFESLIKQKNSVIFSIINKQIVGIKLLDF